ncbi:DUF6319 family protein [Nakamurella sp.]|uniref:DUF6319 family protein n=1 Tax=Nakamurella sp. TaxID=1869182 RepID=UPI003B3AAE4C
MPPRRRTAPPPIDVEDLRSRLDQGKIVRVAIAHSAQFPEGAIGRVRSLGDPAVDGDEFIHVELSVNGMKDLLPFAPADLTAPARASAVRSGSAGGASRGAAVATNGAARTVTNGAVTNGAGTTGAGTNGAGTNGAGTAVLPPGEPLIAPAVPARPGHGPAAPVNGAGSGNGAAADHAAGAGLGHGAATNGGAAAHGPMANGSPGGGPAPAVDRIFFGGPARPSSADPAGPAKAPRPAQPAAKAAVKSGAKPAAKRRGPAVAISIGTTDTDPPQWRLEAKVGAKVVVRHGSVAPARVWELVGLLGDETLTRAVGTVLDEQRQAAQSRADALAAELAAVQAELAELPEPTG